MSAWLVDAQGALPLTVREPEGKESGFQTRAGCYPPAVPNGNCTSSITVSPALTARAGRGGGRRLSERLRSELPGPRGAAPGPPGCRAASLRLLIGGPAASEPPAAAAAPRIPAPSRRTLPPEQLHLRPPPPPLHPLSAPQPNRWRAGGRPGEPRPAGPGSGAAARGRARRQDAAHPVPRPERGRQDGPAGPPGAALPEPQQPVRLLRGAGRPLPLRALPGGGRGR